MLIRSCGGFEKVCLEGHGNLRDFLERLNGNCFELEIVLKLFILA